MADMLSCWQAETGTPEDAQTAHDFHSSNVVWVNTLIDLMHEGSYSYNYVYREISARMPKGWTWVGAGCYRSVYRSPAGVLYKVNRDLCDDYNGNTQEANNILDKAPDMPWYVQCPAMALYEVDNTSAYGEWTDTVLAMVEVDRSIAFEECDGTECDYRNCSSNEGCKALDIQCASQAFSRAGEFTFDAHAGNVFPDRNGIIWIVDLGI